MFPRAALALWGLAMLLALAAVTRGGTAWWLIWPALNFAGLAFSYSQERPRPFGKRGDGTLRGEWVVLYFPLLILTWSIWHLWRLVTRERAFDPIDGTLIVGRRLLPSEPLPDADHYVDLTQEFAEPRAIRERPGYWSFPILDAAAPSPDSLLEVVLQLLPARTLYVHCAQGHGRTGLVASVILLATGRAVTAAEALERIQRVRPGVRLSMAQLQCLGECERLLKRPAAPDTPKGA